MIPFLVPLLSIDPLSPGGPVKRCEPGRLPADRRSEQHPPRSTSRPWRAGDRAGSLIREPEPVGSMAHKLRRAGALRSTIPTSPRVDEADDQRRRPARPVAPADQGIMVRYRVRRNIPELMPLRSPGPPAGKKPGRVAPQTASCPSPPDAKPSQRVKRERSTVAIDHPADLHLSTTAVIDGIK